MKWDTQVGGGGQDRVIGTSGDLVIGKAKTYRGGAETRRNPEVEKLTPGMMGAKYLFFGDELGEGRDYNLRLSHHQPGARHD